VIDFYRKNGREQTIISEVLEEIKDEKQDIANFIEKDEDGKMVRDAIKILTDDQQEIITLKFINELENKEIAELIGKKEEAIRQLQHRALENLREYFNKKQNGR
jgi:RNA polymerase sigma-70 factor (ECF subfamily)